MTDKIILPEHIGIIMDGNGRWAKKRGLPRNMGHKKGAEVFEDISCYCRDLGIKYLTVYAFSTENWKRPKEEVEGVMNLMRSYLKNMKRQQTNILRCVLSAIKRLLMLTFLNLWKKQKMQKQGRPSPPSR